MIVYILVGAVVAYFPARAVGRNILNDTYRAKPESDDITMAILFGMMTWLVAVLFWPLALVFMGIHRVITDRYKYQEEK